MKSLVFFGPGHEGAARKRSGEGAVLVAWGKADALGAAGPSAADRQAADDAAARWTKEFGRHPILDGRSLRELLRLDGLDLWWPAEIYLHYTSRAPHRVRLIETFARLLQSHAPDEVEAVGLPAEDELLLSRVAVAQGVLFHRQPGTAPLRGWVDTVRVSLESRWNNFKTLCAACKTRGLGGAGKGAGGALFLTHRAFWRERSDGAGGREAYEHYFGRLIPAVASTLPPFVVAVGPKSAFRRRGLAARFAEWLSPRKTRGPFVGMENFTTLAVARRTLRATGEIRRLWRRVRDLPGMRTAFCHRGVAFADLSRADLAATLLLQLPWAVRSHEEMRGVLSAVRPSVCCLYAESSGFGRVALAACREAGVPTVAIQHGILYPGYYSYHHEADEEACPRPDKTALYGEAARELLMDLGSYDPASLVVTGSAKFDELLSLAASSDRELLRTRLGCGKDERLVVVASRFRAIRDTHQSIGTAFAPLVEAVAALGGIRLVVKPHPSEPREEYLRVLAERASPSCALAPPELGLPELLLAADALVTVESLSAVEALVLGRRVMILNMPTNLAELVAAGAAMGVPSGSDPTPFLRSLLFDEEEARALEAGRLRYLSRVAQGADGHATERIVSLVVETARSGPHGRV